MAEDDDRDSKTEQPTGKKLQDAHEHGQMPISREISHLFMLSAVVVSVLVLFPMLMRAMREQLLIFIERPDQIVLSADSLQKILSTVLVGIGPALILIALIFIIAAVAGHGLQSGFNFAPERLIPDITRLSPMRGFAKIFSLNSLVEFFKNTVKFIIIGGISFMVFWPTLRRVEMYTGLEPAAQVHEISRICFRLIITILCVVTVIAVADYIYQYFHFMRNMMMTREEVRDENKQSEGNPTVKGRIRKMRIERGRKRMMAKVPEADVVVTNPTHFAVALKYETGKMNAPLVVAKGQDFVAFKIREIAEASGVAIVENPPLARTLFANVEIDEEIKPEHYRAVAEVISYVYRLRNKLKPPSPAPAPPQRQAKPANKPGAGKVGASKPGGGKSGVGKTRATKPGPMKSGPTNPENIKP